MILDISRLECEYLVGIRTPYSEESAREHSVQEPVRKGLCVHAPLI